MVWQSWLQIAHHHVRAPDGLNLEKLPLQSEVVQNVV